MLVPTVVFFGSFLTERGETYRKRFVKYLILILVNSFLYFYLAHVLENNILICPVG